MSKLETAPYLLLLSAPEKQPDTDVLGGIQERDHQGEIAGLLRSSRMLFSLAQRRFELGSKNSYVERLQTDIFLAGSAVKRISAGIVAEDARLVRLESDF